MIGKTTGLPPGAEQKILNTMVKQQITHIDEGWVIKGTNFKSVCKRYANDTATWTFIDGGESIAFSFDMLRWDSGEVVDTGAGLGAGQIGESDAGVSVLYDPDTGISIEILQDHYSWQKVVHLASLESLGRIPAEARWLEIVFTIDEWAGLKEGIIDAPVEIAKNSQFQPVKAWDTKDNCEEAFGEVRDGKLIKRIPVEWLLTAEYPVSTDATITFGSENVFNSATSSYISVAALDSTHFVVAYRDAGVSDHGVARVGVVSGTTISSYGAKNEFNAAASSYTSVAALDSTHFVVSYKDTANSSHGTARVGVVSGTTISSYGAENVFNSSSTAYVAVAALDATHFVTAYMDTFNSNNGTAIVGVVSGTTISSYGAENVFNASSTSNISIAALDATHFVVAYKDTDNSNYGTAIVGVVSGTTISSYGAENVFNAGATYYTAVAALDSTHFVVAYQDNGNSSYGTAIVGVVSGTTISSYGAENVFDSAAIAYTTIAALDSTNLIAVYNDGGNLNYGTGIVGEISTTSMAVIMHHLRQQGIS